MFGITYDTWQDICRMYFEIKPSTQKSYLQFFPFSKLSSGDKEEIISHHFFEKYIETGAFTIFETAMLRTENYISKSDGSFRDSSLISIILFLVLQSIGKEISKVYKPRRPDAVAVYYGGNYDDLRPLYKKDYDNFYKDINASIEQYSYFIKTDITNFYTNINIDKLVHEIDSICNDSGSVISQTHLRLYKEMLLYCGNGRFPLLENSLCSSYLATIVYLDQIDYHFYNHIKNKVNGLSNFRIIRYVDDMYILFTPKFDKTSDLNKLYNEICNEYSSLLKDYGLALNQKKCRWSPVHLINEELKKSLYDEIFYDKECNIEKNFAGTFYKFIYKFKKSLETEFINVDKYNNLIKDSFSLPDIEFIPDEVFNTFIYVDNEELSSPEVVQEIGKLIDYDISFISIDPKRLTLMVMKTRDQALIKKMLNGLFDRYRANKWNSYDTSITLTYLIQRGFQHNDLLNIFKDACPDLYRYYDIFCRESFNYAWIEPEKSKFLEVIGNDKNCYYLYFMYLAEKQKNDMLAMYAYYKNFFDRLTTDMAFYAGYNAGKDRPSYKKFYDKDKLSGFYSCIKDSKEIIVEAQKYRNQNPVSHASAELIDKQVTSKDLIRIIENLKYLLLNRIMNINRRR